MIEIDKKSLAEAIDKILTQIAIDIFNRSQEKIIEFKAIDTGLLRRSGYVRVDKFLEKEIGYSAPYSIYVEFGRGAGKQPPIEPIRKWVKRKLKVRNEKEANKLSWAIAKKIAKEGIKPRPFMRNAIEEVKEEWLKKEKDLIIEGGK